MSRDDLFRLMVALFVVLILSSIVISAIRNATNERVEMWAGRGAEEAGKPITLPGKGHYGQ